MADENTKPARPDLYPSHVRVVLPGPIDGLAERVAGIEESNCDLSAKINGDQGVLWQLAEMKERVARLEERAQPSDVRWAGTVTAMGKLDERLTALEQQEEMLRSAVASEHERVTELHEAVEALEQKAAPEQAGDDFFPPVVTEPDECDADCSHSPHTRRKPAPQPVEVGQRWKHARLDDTALVVAVYADGHVDYDILGSEWRTTLDDFRQRYTLVSSPEPAAKAHVTDLMQAWDESLGPVTDDAAKSPAPLLVLEELVGALRNAADWLLYINPNDRVLGQNSAIAMAAEALAKAEKLAKVPCPSKSSLLSIASGLDEWECSDDARLVAAFLRQLSEVLP